MSGRKGILAPLLIGALGTAVLVALCVWQIQRLAWKEGLIDELRVRLSEAPMALMESPAPEDEFTRVTVTGRFEGKPGAHGFADAPFLTTYEKLGAGYRVIQPLTLADGARVMIDRGFIPLELKNRGGVAAEPVAAPAGSVEIIGALRFPEEEADPPFGTGDNVWIARDLAAMARLFEAQPVLIVAETSTAVKGAKWPRPTPLTVQIRNNHLNYAITWGLLALAWAGMTGFWVRALSRH